MNLNIFTAFLKNKNIIFKIRRSKVTDYAALNQKQKNPKIASGVSHIIVWSQIQQNKGAAVMEPLWCSYKLLAL